MDHSPAPVSQFWDGFSPTFLQELELEFGRLLFQGKGKEMPFVSNQMPPALCPQYHTRALYVWSTSFRHGSSLHTVS